MKYLLLILIATSSCTTYRTINLRTTSPNPDVYKTPSFEKCIQSGLQVIEDEYIEYYNNCEVILKRPIEEREKKLWLLN